MKVFLKIVGGFFLYLITTLAVLFVGLYGGLKIAVDGPSDHFRQIFITSLMESSAGPIAARMVLTDDQINEILANNTTIEFDQVTDPALVSVMREEAEAAAAAAAQAGIDAETNLDPDGDGIEIHEISGPMYHGMMMIVYDPSRVICATIDNYTHSGAGMTLQQLIEKYGAVAGINGGQYEDESGLGIGGWPVGVVMSQGVLRADNVDEYYEAGTDENGDPIYQTRTSLPTVGFTQDDILVVGTFGGGYAESIGLRDAVSFGPALIVNGVAANYSGVGGGLNPRTAIGQRADGAVLMLCIEGRRSTSMGATMADLIDIMVEYGAVNAFNLDGGMSSSMVYNGEEIVDNANIRGDRAIPTAWVVLPLDASSSSAEVANEEA
ncbi:MAG: phosphodiester glycosidase family protein [Clostridiales bacterium]|nr:phosphodiester glycosidase family protein [Clostridiales bacterium]